MRPGEREIVTPLNVMDEVAKLKAMGWADLRREAKRVGLPEAICAGARTRDEVRLAIIDKRIEDGR
jgi:hypothetical protein